jgi:flagellar biosynthesis protein FlhF
VKGEKADSPAIELGPQAERLALAKVIEKKEKIEAAQPVAGENLASEDLKELKSSLFEMKAMLAGVSQHIEKIEVAESSPNRGNWTALQQKVHDRLIRAEVDPILARGFIATLARQGTTSFEEAINLLEPPFVNLIKTSGAIERSPQGVRTIALIGPTGVGKTTTIAKLAANFRLNGHYDIGLITIDTYRVAAVEQLKTYGDIIGIPVEIVTTPTALRDAIHGFRDKEIILIDTAGRSPSNRMHLNELKGFLDQASKPEVHLVLSATTNRANLKRIYESFLPVGIDRLIVTKLDEACSFGGIFSLLHQWGKPLSYFTTGQSVPDDIRTAEAPYLARQILGELKA